LKTKLDEVVLAYANLLEQTLDPAPLPAGYVPFYIQNFLSLRPQYDAAVAQSLTAINSSAEDARTALTNLSDVLALGRPEDEPQLQSLIAHRDRYFALVRLLVTKLHELGQNLRTPYEQGVALYLEEAPDAISQTSLHALSGTAVPQQFRPLYFVEHKTLGGPSGISRQNYKP
jgi:hypothetical protein